MDKKTAQVITIFDVKKITVFRVDYVGLKNAIIV